MKSAINTASHGISTDFDARYEEKKVRSLKSGQALGMGL
jgi:hypothetical protein